MVHVHMLDCNKCRHAWMFGSQTEMVKFGIGHVAENALNGELHVIEYIEDEIKFNKPIVVIA